MYNKKMSRSIDKPSEPAAGELLCTTLLPVAAPVKTYKIPEGLPPAKAVASCKCWRRTY